MPGPRDRNKGSWCPSERDWALARELASAREGSRDKSAWALLARMEGNGTGDSSCVWASPIFGNVRDFLSDSVTKILRLRAWARRPPYCPDLPSMSEFYSLWLGPPNSTSLPWCMTRSTMAAASLSSANTVPHLPNSRFVVKMTLLLS